MCGVVGFWSFGNSVGSSEMSATVQEMAALLERRGPDDQGSWVDPEIGLALGHRRLSVIDISAAGHQPMKSADEKWVISYNGELYNSDSLRNELTKGGTRFRGHSDTEVIVEACTAWGIPETVRRLSGMFAFAAFDRANRELFLVRDRTGIKPLYWGRLGETLFFGSQLKAFIPHSEWRPRLNRDAVVSYTRFGYVPSPHSIYRDIYKLDPGHLVRIDADGGMRVDRYWNVDDLATDGAGRLDGLSDAEAIERLDSTLRDAIRRQMISDVPTGAFLSGGIDSSVVAALMQQESSHSIKTFSIGFTEDAFDEAVHARAVAKHIGSDHTELYLTPQDAIDIIPSLPDWYDEPFADSSQIPTYLVSQLARQSVVVALSGDGGDELFAGYNRYLWSERLRRNLMRVPGFGRRLAAGVIRALPERGWDSVFSLIPASGRPVQAGNKMFKLAGLLSLRNREEIYRSLVSQWRDPDTVTHSGEEPTTAMDDRALSEAVPDYVSWMQLMDMQGYLPGDILTKVDRASMAVSLEARVPLLDNEVVDFAWSLPGNMKIRDGEAKWLLRQVLYRHVPRALVDRPKMGFGVPIGDWLCSDLRDWAESLLSPDRLEIDGVFDPEPIRSMWTDHLAGNGNWQYPLWVILMFQAWRDSPSDVSGAL